MQKQAAPHCLLPINALPGKGEQSKYGLQEGREDFLNLSLNWFVQLKASQNIMKMPTKRLGFLQKKAYRAKYLLAIISLDRDNIFPALLQELLLVNNSYVGL